MASAYSCMYFIYGSIIHVGTTYIRVVPIFFCKQISVIGQYELVLIAINLVKY